MATHIKRSHKAGDVDFLSFHGARVSSWKRPANGDSVLERQHFPDPGKLKGVPDDKNTLIPPLHWHWYQEERFHVLSGRFIFTLEGQDKIISSTNPQPVIIPPGVRHTFKVDPTSPEPCALEISTTASPHAKTGIEQDEFGVNEDFFRNVYSYLDDCEAQGVGPSIPQLLLFLHHAEVSLAFPGPRWLVNPLSYAFGLVVGVGLGEYVLGYKRSYPEYFSAVTATSKRAP